MKKIFIVLSALFLAFGLTTMSLDVSAKSKGKSSAKTQQVVKKATPKATPASKATQVKTQQKSSQVKKTTTNDSAAVTTSDSAAIHTKWKSNQHKKHTHFHATNDSASVKIGKKKNHKKASKGKAKNKTYESGLIPKKGLTFTYRNTSTNEASATFTAVESDGAISLMKANGTAGYFSYLQSNDFLMVSLYGAADALIYVGYPLTEGQKVTSYSVSDSAKTTELTVEHVNKSVKTKAGQFKNTVILKFPDGKRVYIAKNIGVVKITDASGKVTDELTKIK